MGQERHNEGESDDARTAASEVLGTLPDRPALRARTDSSPAQARVAGSKSDATVSGQTEWNEAMSAIIARAPLYEPRELSTHVGRAQLARLAPIARFGKYDLLGRLAYGGMAEIFLAREREGGTDRFVVIKRVLPHVAVDSQFVEMFIGEARVAMHLNHPGICHVYSFGQEQDSYFLAMEWVNGATLSRILRRTREKPMALGMTLKIIAQVAEALDHAHRASDAEGEPLGIVHRDVSPQNIMVSYDGVVKLLDFGIAKATSHSQRTEAGVIKGKYSYMSPQQCVGEPIDSRADVFALGICLYEAIAGDNPFKKTSEYDTMRALVFDEVPPVPNAPPHVQRVVAKALEKKVEARYQSAAELQTDLESAIVSLGAVVTHARVAEEMARIFASEIREGPRLDTHLTESAVRELTPASDGLRTRFESLPATEPSKGGSLTRILLAISVSVALFAIGFAYYAFSTRMPIVSQLPPDLSAVRSGPSGPETANQGTEHQAAVNVAPNAPEAVVEPHNPEPQNAEPQNAEPHDEASDWIAAEEINSPGELPTQDSRRRGDRHSDRSRSEHESERTPHTAAEVAVAPTNDATLSVNTTPWSRVFLVTASGERSLGTTPLGRVPVPSGELTLRLVDRDGVSHTQHVSVNAGQNRSLFFRLDAAPSVAPTVPLPAESS